MKRRTFLALSGAALLAAPLPTLAAGRAARISLEDAHKQADSGELALIDIRAPGEWAQSGIAPNAQTISMHMPDFLKKLDAAMGGDKSRKIGLICAAGHRSDWLQTRLKPFGYENTYSVAEGMLGSKDGPGWIRRGLPTKKYK